MLIIVDVPRIEIGKQKIITTLIKEESIGGLFRRISQHYVPLKIIIQEMQEAGY